MTLRVAARQDKLERHRKLLKNRFRSPRSRHDYNAFPVVAPDGTLRGIVSKLDVLRLLHPDEQFRLPDPKRIAATRVAAIMRPGTLTVEGDDPIVVAADLMVATGRRSLPVVRRGGGWPMLVGIVSRGDLLRGLRFELAEDAPRRAARV